MTNLDPDNEASFQVFVIPSDLEHTRVPKQTILEELARCGFGEQDTFGVKLALEEALANAIKHGSCCDSAKPVTIRYSVTPQRVVIIVRDEGPGFEPDCVPDCTAPERLPLPNGRGIMLIQAYMDEVCYRDNGREIYLVKRHTTDGHSHD